MTTEEIAAGTGDKEKLSAGDEEQRWKTKWLREREKVSRGEKGRRGKVHKLRHARSGAGEGSNSTNELTTEDGGKFRGKRCDEHCNAIRPVTWSTLGVSPPPPEEGKGSASVGVLANR